MLVRPPGSMWQKPDALNVGEYYLIGNVHENYICVWNCQADLVASNRCACSLAIQNLGEQSGKRVLAESGEHLEMNDECWERPRNDAWLNWSCLLAKSGVQS